MASIVVVDHDAAERERTTVALQRAGYQVAQADDGGRAVDLLKTQPDLLVLEILVPVIGGWGVLEHVGRMAKPSRVVVATSSHELVPPGQCGHFVAGYLIKPFDEEQLLKVCHAALTLAPVSAAEGNRKEPRRTFLAEAMLLSPDTDQPVARGQLVQLSMHGFRVDLSLPFRSGDAVRIGFLVPGRTEPVKLNGRVRWRNDVTLGAEIHDVDPADQELLRDLLLDSSG